MPAKPGPLRPHEERNNYARQAPRSSGVAKVELGDTFLIVTEGQVTERLYCERLREKLKLRAAHVCVVQPGYTDALGLIQAANRLREETRNRPPSEKSSADVSSYDHVWVVFDTDVAERRGTLPAALELARRLNIKIALSTPCIEVWLLLHFRDRPGPFHDSATVQRDLSAAWGQPTYDKRHVTFERLWRDLLPNIPAAVSRAEQTRAYHKNARTPSPANPSTDMDQLVLALNAATRPEQRLFN